MPEPLIVAPDQRPAPLSIAGFAITVLAADSQTAGYEIFHQIGPAGTGPGPHQHPWDESFYVLNGTVVCGVGDEETVALPGTLVHIPANLSHWYKFGDDGGEFISMTSAGNASKMYTDFDRESSWENPDRSVFVELAARHGQTVSLPTAD